MAVEEREQLTARYVKFDMRKLCRLAASTIGSESCVHVMKIFEGQFNKVSLLTMDDGRSHCETAEPQRRTTLLTTASRVATMNFVHKPPP